MTRCSEAQEALLVADLAELRGHTDSELSRHVADCPTCQVAAQRIQAVNGVLDDHLAQAPPIDVDAILRRAELHVSPSRSGGRPLARWSAVAAAAAVGALFIARGGDPALPGSPITLTSTQSVEYEVPVGRNLAVLPTQNPDITVLWLF